MTQLLCPFFRGKPNYKLDSAEEPLWSKSDSEKDDLRCIPRQFTSRTDEASAYEFSTLFMHFHSSSKRGGSSAKSISLTDPFTAHSSSHSGQSTAETLFMKRRLFLNQLARAAAFAPLARCAWGADTNNLPGPSVAAGFEFLHTTDWLARWQKSILKEANTRYCDTELGETVAWLTAPFLNGVYYGYCATRDVSWVARLIDWADSWLKRGVKEPDGFIGWPKKGTGSAAEEAFLTDSMLGEATCLRPVVLMADKILKTPALKDKFGSRAQAWLGLAEQIFEKWVARGCWREVMDGGLWVAPEFAIDRQTGQWTSGYARRNVDGFSNPANKENYIALWLLAMWDATQK